MHKKRVQKKLAFAILTVVLGLFFIHPTAAFAQNFNVTVTPEVQYMRIKPGSKIRHTITLENKGTTPITVTPSIHDFEADGTSGKPVLKKSTTFPYLDVEDIENSTLTIPPQKHAQLGLLFSVPEDATEKEYPLTILFQSTPLQSSADTSGSQLVGAIGSNVIVLISKDDQLSELINIDSIGLPFFIDSFKKVEITPKVKNNHFAATSMAGTVVVKNMLDTEVAQFSIFPDTVLGYSSRNLRALRNEFQPDLEPEALPFAFKPKFLLGLYTVEITITAPYTSENPEQIIAYDTFNFFAFPILPIIVVMVSTTTAIFYFFYRKR